MQGLSAHEPSTAPGKNGRQPAALVIAPQARGCEVVVPAPHSRPGLRRGSCPPGRCAEPESHCARTGRGPPAADAHRNCLVRPRRARSVRGLRAGISRRSSHRHGGGSSEALPGAARGWRAGRVEPHVRRHRSTARPAPPKKLAARWTSRSPRCPPSGRDVLRVGPARPGAARRPSRSYQPPGERRVPHE